MCDINGTQKLKVLGPVFCNSLQDPVDTCSGVVGNITQYQIRFQSGSVVDTENVNISRCTAGKCSHTFKPPTNPPSSYDSVSVAADGVGVARTCTAQTISELITLYYHTSNSR